MIARRRTWWLVALCGTAAVVCAVAVRPASEARLRPIVRPRDVLASQTGKSDRPILPVRVLSEWYRHLGRWCAEVIVWCEDQLPLMPAQRQLRKLLKESESIRHIPEVWERMWFIDLDDDEAEFRKHGGVI